MRKRLFIFLALVLGSAFAQSPGPPSITTRELIAPVFTENPAPVSNLSTAIIGSGGPQTYYYWVVTNYTLGATSAFGPFPVSNAPYVLSSGNYITLVPSYIPGILSVDLLRTSTPTQPSGSCTCAVATGVTSGAVNDQSNTLSSYTVNPVNVNQFTMTLTNEVVGAGATHMLLRQNGVLVCDLSIGCGAGGISAIVAGTNVAINPSSPCTTGTCTINATGGGSTPGTPLNSCQYNNAGSLGGVLGCSVNPASGTVTPANMVQDVVNNVVTANTDWQFTACETGCVYSIAGSLGLSVGSNTITFPVVPPGVNGVDTIASFQGHYLQITPAAGDSSPVEYAAITGGTAVGGSTTGGTITFSAAYAHNANYVIGSATTGISEAISAANQLSPTFVASNISLDPLVPYTCNAPIYIFSKNAANTFDGKWAVLTHNSFGDCITDYSTSFDFSHLILKPAATNGWSCSPSSPASIPGTSNTATLTCGTCPTGFFANIPNQKLWLAGASGGMVTGPYEGIGEFVQTISGGTCTPGLTNGTIVIQQISPNIFAPFATLSPHDAGYTISNKVGSYVVDGGNFNGHIHDLRYVSNGVGFGQGPEIQILQDQSCGIDNISDDAGYVTRRDADYQSAGIFNSTTGAICYVGPAVNISEPSKCVEWDGGNDFHWDGGVCQGFTAGGVLFRHRFSSFGAMSIKNVHFENGAQSCIWFGNTCLGDPEILVNGGTAPLHTYTDFGGGIPLGANGAPWPTFLPQLASQTQTQNYFVVAHNNTSTFFSCTIVDCLSPPVYIGSTSNTNPATNPVTVNFSAWGDNSVAVADDAVSSYDLLAVSTSSGSIGSPFPQPPEAPGLYLVASGTPASWCNTHAICTVIDNVAPGFRTSYTPNWQGTSKTWVPPIGYMPGVIALIAGATYIGDPACVNTQDYFFSAHNNFPAVFTHQSLGNDVGVNCPNIVSPIGSQGLAQQCWQTSDSSGNVPCSNGGASNANHIHTTIFTGRTSSTITTSAVQNWSTFIVNQDSGVCAMLGVVCGTGNYGPFPVTPTPGVGLVVNSTTAPGAGTNIGLDIIIGNN